MSKRIILFVVFAVVISVLAAGTALAVTKTGTNGNNHIEGIYKDDKLLGRGGSDVIVGKRGDDLINPGWGYDRVFAGSGNDYIKAVDKNGRDHIDCGAGYDRVETVHHDDITLENCEIARDPNRR